MFLCFLTLELYHFYTKKHHTILLVRYINVHKSYPALNIHYDTNNFRPKEWHAINVLKILHNMILFVFYFTVLDSRFAWQIVNTFLLPSLKLKLQIFYTEASKFLYNLHTEVSMTPLARTSSLGVQVLDYKLWPMGCFHTLPVRSIYNPNVELKNLQDFRVYPLVTSNDFW